ncbi:hypothetical protein AVEN_72285-1 [Araneus ventricosus]|uniref:Uncharacterized protein n=1 Tax=Araneus ventricosus TaxID=182803 RepID=A0A4Y2VQ75_ARAVE|nr:hypothetical protein AVEN_84687-1 [Araneus ventricosus]GBO26358.1 hypothetical protein AVEN_32027-1 [Araneus ventricosus]GBO26366.1 hypothetical protein AVEN_72285-1 [Araneus ventricosus]
MIAFIQINRILASSPREPRRNLFAAKHGDLADKTPSACKNNIFPHLLLPPTHPPTHPKHCRSLWNGESGSVRGVRGRIRTGNTDGSVRGVRGRMESRSP